MRSRLEMVLHLLDHAHGTMARNVEGVTLNEALFVPEGGYRSVLGTLKHAAGWSHVYRLYAFDTHPRHWNEIDWPHGLRDTIVETEEYLQGVIEWFNQSHRRWLEDLGSTHERQMDCHYAIYVVRCSYSNCWAAYSAMKHGGRAR